MAKKKVFCSFDYDKDKHLKGALVSQAKSTGSPFSVNDFSLLEAQPEKEWLSKAQGRIAKCDVFIVLLGRKTYKASGVLKEVNIAKGMRKDRFQLRPQGKRNENNVPIPGAGDVIVWKWKNLNNRLYQQ